MQAVRRMAGSPSGAAGQHADERLTDEELLWSSPRLPT
jgi:hypothetical protein